MQDSTKRVLARVYGWAVVITVLTIGLCAYDTILRWMGVGD